MDAALTFKFLGVGNARATEIGSAAAVLERDEAPSLLLDCGPRTLEVYAGCYPDRFPPAVFITHLHLDHVGGLEQLFYDAYFNSAHKPVLFVPAKLIPALAEKIANTAFVLSEGSANFWDAFQLMPVNDTFWWQGLLFSVFPSRHSGYEQAYGLCLPGAFLYTGDTRPIPEVILHFASHGEVVFHDCGLHSLPAHTGLEDLRREYPSELRARLVLYHYESVAAGEAIVANGYRIAHPGERFALKPALAPAARHDTPVTRIV